MGQRSYVVKGSPQVLRRMAFWALCGIYGLGMLALCGCETAKGFKQDLENLKISDERFRERYW